LKRPGAAQSLVGFAKSRGGQVFFGMTNEGEAKGLQVGLKTIEDLTDDLEAHIYPALPLEFDQFPAQNDRTTSLSFPGWCGM
jgi:predicted HTH transcriptional regulator